MGWFLFKSSSFQLSHSGSRWFRFDVFLEQPCVSIQVAGVNSLSEAGILWQWKILLGVSPARSKGWKKFPFVVDGLGWRIFRFLHQQPFLICCFPGYVIQGHKHPVALLQQTANERTRRGALISSRKRWCFPFDVYSNSTKTRFSLPY